MWPRVEITVHHFMQWFYIDTEIRMLLYRYLEWSLNPKKIRKQDSYSAFAAVALSENGFLIAKNFFMKQFTTIRN